MDDEKRKIPEVHEWFSDMVKALPDEKLARAYRECLMSNNAYKAEIAKRGFKLAIRQEDGPLVTLLPKPITELRVFKTVTETIEL